MAAIGASSSSKDRPIYARVMGLKRYCYWYVIEEKAAPNESSGDEVIGCESERDRVRRISLPEVGLLTSNVAVLNSCLYLISGHFDRHVGYHHISVDLRVKETEWHEGGGEFADPYGGGAAVGADGYIYSVGQRQYRFRLGEWEKLPVPPQGWDPLPNELLYRQRLLALTKKKLYVYMESTANVMLSFDLESGKWDEGYLDDNFEGHWSPGVVLLDRYLFTLGTRSPKLNSEITEANRKRVQEGKQKILEEEVGGVYVFDLENRQWLDEPVQGLPSDGTVIPWNFQPLPESFDGPRFNPYLYQIREDDEHHLALLWDDLGRHPTSGLHQCSLIWCKFIVRACKTSATDDDQITCFSAHSLSRGFCPLDEDTYNLLNCALGM